MSLRTSRTSGAESYAPLNVAINRFAHLAAISLGVGVEVHGIACGIRLPVFRQIWIPLWQMAFAPGVTIEQMEQVG